MLDPAPPPEGHRGSAVAFVDAEMRKAMGEQAVALARAVNYESAGTVEFVSPVRQGVLLPGNEHPPAGRTPGRRMITGLDLVEQMIRVAYGEKPPDPGRCQDQRLGHGMPDQRRRPVPRLPASTGRLVKFQPPVEIPGHVRVDTGVYTMAARSDVLRLDDRQADRARRHRAAPLPACATR